MTLSGIGIESGSENKIVSQSRISIENRTKTEITNRTGVKSECEKIDIENKGIYSISTRSKLFLEFTSPDNGSTPNPVLTLARRRGAPPDAFGAHQLKLPDFYKTTLTYSKRIQVQRHRQLFHLQIFFCFRRYGN
ncbi:hypothetical protein EVAR_41975_1 [Eumeta japonica]|uniref:Uncharacterized protein n=1 Tax=Eumeta variegata TaxID=151549 RepID=A0A4C1WTV0_EUMVA|nr:hypothetical protein EVAR_41975_1 [Eumeta japonica]